MSLTIKSLVQSQQIPATTTVMYTCPASTIALVKHAVLTNTSGGALTVNVYVVPSGGTADATAKILDTYSIGSHTAYTSPELCGIVLNTGDTIQMDASSAASISLNMDGILQT